METDVEAVVLANVKKAFGYQMRFDLQKGFPAITTKKLSMESSCFRITYGF